MKKNERSTKHGAIEVLRSGACSCQKLRRASRAATRLYDAHLRPTGITIGQYSLLAALYSVPAMSVQKLARRLEWDRTTLTRSLARLDREGLVAVSSHTEDMRVRSVTITQAGLEKLTQAYPHWTKAQEEMQKALGQRGLKDFSRILDGAIQALEMSE